MAQDSSTTAVYQEVLWLWRIVNWEQSKVCYLKQMEEHIKGTRPNCKQKGSHTSKNSWQEWKLPDKPKNVHYNDNSDAK